MADIAITFHWPPESMGAMSLSDLMGWRAQAARRCPPPPEKPKKGSRHGR